VKELGLGTQKARQGPWQLREISKEDEGMLRFMIAATVLLLAPMSASAEEKTTATLFKNPGCKCCDSYADYLRSNGFDVTVIENRNMTMIKQKHGVREDLEGCHTMIVSGYVVEGHVPVGPIKRLLTDKPAIKGITLPGMPAGSPGMSGTKEGPFTILSITGEDGPAPVYVTE